MAKNPKSVDGIDRDLLAQIVAATDNGSFVYSSAAAHQPMLANVPSLVEVNTQMVNPADATQFATRATSDAKAFLAATPAVVAGNAPATHSEAHKYEIITGATLPEPKKRGNSFGSGAPTKYPFADMPVGGAFFSANSEHVKSNAVKALGSTVSSQNRKYAEPVVENGEVKTKTIKQAIRDENNKPKLDGNGKKITELKVIPVLKYNRKFTIRPVEGGKNYGTFTAPADGALIARVI